MRPLAVLFGLLLAGGTLRADVVINEIMYHGAGEPEVEYVELYNSGSEALDLSGWHLIDNDDTHAACPLSGILAPGAYLVVADDLAIFGAAYPGVTNLNPIAFGSGFGLGNSDDTLRVLNAQGQQVDRVDYADDPPWPPEPDGGGPSLELINPAADNRDPTNWRASVSTRPQGSPGLRNTVFVQDMEPVVRSPRRSPDLPQAADTVHISAEVADDGAVAAVELFVDEGSGFVARPMADDGLHGDSAPGDGWWGASIEPHISGSVVRYYVSATDDVGQTATAPSGAPADWHAYTVDHVPPVLRINEILTINEAGAEDGAGDNDDWLELHNPGPSPVPLQGMFLTDDLDDGRRFALPAVTLAPGERILFWCDDETAEGPFHASFHMSGAGGDVGLFDAIVHGNVLVHSIRYGPQGADVSFGYLPEDADAPEYLSPPTPEATNAASAVLSPVCINEFLSASGLGIPDWIEVYNRGAATVDIGGWHLSDDPAQPTRFTIPAGTLLAPGAFAVFDETELGFGLSADGNEALLLTGVDGVAGVDWYDYGPQLPDVSQGRLADGAPNWHSFSAWTAGAANQCPAGAFGPEPVTGLRFDTVDTLRWDPVSGAEVYDVVAGNLTVLRESGGGFEAAVTACLENNGIDTLAWDPGPGPGAAFYLVRGADFACGFGSFDSGAPSQVGSRDGAAAAAASCP